MSARSAQDPEDRGNAVPRDLPDQQADQDTPEDDAARHVPEEHDASAADLPDTDEAGTGPRGQGEPEDGERELPEPVEPTD